MMKDGPISPVGRFKLAERSVPSTRQRGHARATRPAVNHQTVTKLSNYTPKTNQNIRSCQNTMLLRYTFFEVERNLGDTLKASTFFSRALFSHKMLVCMVCVKIIILCLFMHGMSHDADSPAAFCFVVARK